MGKLAVEAGVYGAELYAENERLRKALKFYADAESWAPRYEYVDGAAVAETGNAIDDDGGQIANAALRYARVKS